MKCYGSDLLPLQAKQEALIEKHQRRQFVQIWEMEFMTVLPFGQPCCQVALMNCAAQIWGDSEIRLQIGVQNYSGYA